MALSGRLLAFHMRRAFAPSSVRFFADAAEMPFTFASPRKAYFQSSGNIRQVDVPTFSGNLGILPRHVPVLAVLKPGVLTVYKDDGSEQKFFVSSGQLTVNEDSSVQILAEEACELSELDLSACRSEVDAANRAVTQATGDPDASAAAHIRQQTAEAALGAAQAAN